MKEHRFGLTRQAPSAYAKVGEIMPEPTAPDIQPGKGPAVLPRPDVKPAPSSVEPNGARPGHPATPEAASHVPTAHDALRMVGTPEAATPQQATPEQAVKPQTLDEAIAENLKDVQDVPLRSRLLVGIKSIFKKGEKEERLIDEDKLKRWLEKWSPDVMTKVLSEHPEAGLFTSAVYQARAVLIKKAIEQGANPFQMEMLLTPERIQELAKEHRVEQEKYEAAHEAEPGTRQYLAEQASSETISSSGKEFQAQGETGEDGSTFSQYEEIPKVGRIELTDIANPHLRRYVKFANDVVGSHNPQTLSEATRMLTDALRGEGITQADAERVDAFIDLLRERQRLLAEKLGREQRDYRTEDLLKDVTNDETGHKITLDDVIADRAIRDKLFDDLFAIVDSTPHEFWQQAFNPLTQGQRHERFMELVLQAKNLRPERDFTRLEDDHLREGFKRYQKKLEDRRKIQDDAREARGESRLGPIEREEVQKRFLAEMNADHDRYQKEFQIRQNLHNASAFLYRTAIEPEQLYNYIREFNGQMADIANRFPGVRKMLDIYEQQVRMAMLEHDGYLRPEDIIGKTKTETVLDENDEPIDVKVQVDDPVIEKRAKEQFVELYNKGMIYFRDEQGRTVDIRKSRPGSEGQPRKFEDWELDRLITTTRGLMLANMRLLSIAAESRLVGHAVFGSYFLQDVLQSYSPNVHLDKKFFVPGVKSLGFMLNEPDRKKIPLTPKFHNVPMPKRPWKKGEKFLRPDFPWERRDAQLVFRRPWSVSEYYARFTEYKTEYNSVGYGLNHPKVEFNRQNPNRAGDAYTWLYSWKVGEKPTEAKNESFTRDFLQKGYRRMVNKHIGELYHVEDGNVVDNIHEDYWRLRHETGIQNPDSMPVSGKARQFGYTTGQKITYEELASQLKGVKYVNLDKKEDSPIDEDIVAINAYIMQHGLGAYENMNWDTVHEKVAHFRDDLNEYVNWIGTGIKFERLRSDIDYGKPKYKKEKTEAAKKLIARIVELQPDKIFLKSEHIKRRTLKQLRDAWASDPDCQENGVFSEKEFQKKLRQTLENLNMMQEDVQKNRDQLIDSGYSFNGGHHTKKVELNLNLIYDPHAGPEGTPPPAPISPDGNALEMPQAYQEHVKAIEDKKKQRTRVEQFMEIIQKDFDTYKETDTKVDGLPAIGYFKEFILDREYYHGFCIWSGDMPVDELKMEGVGPTGAFARAAGDNLAAKKGAEATNQLMSNLKNIRVPEDAYEYLKEIYSAVLTHDGDLASQRMTEVGMMLMQWYGADWKASIPIVGGVQKWFGRASFAQRAYGKRMPVWHAAEKRHLANFMKEKGYINDAQYSDLTKRGAARYFKEVMADNLISISQILALVIAFYILKKSLEKE